MFGTVKLARNTIKSKSTNNSWEIAFDGESSWSFGYEFAKNVVIFSIDNSSSSHTNNQKSNFVLLGEGSTDVINDSTGVVEKNLVLKFASLRPIIT